MESHQKKMRIISGKFRNKKLYFPKNLKTRPLKDSVRENIFNILNHSKNVGFEIENHFVVGYGLDYQENFRNLPEIHAVQFNEKKIPN